MKRILRSNPALTKTLLKYLFRLKEFIRIKINTLAIIYGKGIHPKHRLTDYHNFFLQHIDGGVDTILDIGCGKGELTEDLSYRAKKIIACDINKEYIAYAKRYHSADNIYYYNLSIFNLPLERELMTKKSTIAILSSVLEHIEKSVELLRYLREFCQRILIRVPDIERDWQILFKKELGLAYFLDPTHKREYSEASLKKQLNQGGWSIRFMEKRFGELWAVAE